MIITLDEYKTITGISDDSQNQKLMAIIALVEEDYLSIRGKPFDVDSNGNIVYPSGAKMTAAEMISYKLMTIKGNVGTESETIGDYTVGYSSELLEGYPKSTVQKIKRYARFK